MQRYLSWFFIMVMIGFSGCTFGEDDDSEEPEDELTIVVEADKSQIQEKEQNLNAKRVELREEQQAIRRQKEELRKRLANVSNKDNQLRKKLEDEELKLEQREDQIFKHNQNIEKERSKLEKQKSQLLETIVKMTQKKGGMTIEQREQLIAKREGQISQREKDIAVREKDLAIRERQVTEQLSKLVSLMDELKNSAAGLSRPIVAAAPTSSSSNSANRKSVKRNYNRVKSSMRKKGVLEFDLPERGKGLSAQYNQALQQKDYEEAQNLIDRLASVVNEIQIDATFIQHKFNRINAMASGKKMDRSVERLLAEVTAAFTNGNYQTANTKLNHIYTKLKR